MLDKSCFFLLRENICDRRTPGALTSVRDTPSVDHFQSLFGNLFRMLFDLARAFFNLSYLQCAGLGLAGKPFVFKQASWLSLRRPCQRM